MPKITIVRDSEFMNLFREYHILLNGKPVKRIGRDQTVELAPEPGSVEIRGKVDWCESNRLPLNLSANDEVKIQLSAHPILKLINYLGMINLIPIAILFMLNSPLINLFFYLQIAFFAGLLYFVSIGRKNYLRAVQISASSDLNTMAPASSSKRS